MVWSTKQFLTSRKPLPLVSRDCRIENYRKIEMLLKNTNSCSLLELGNLPSMWNFLLRRASLSLFLAVTASVKYYRNIRSPLRACSGVCLEGFALQFTSRDLSNQIFSLVLIPHVRARFHFSQALFHANCRNFQRRSETETQFRLWNTPLLQMLTRRCPRNHQISPSMSFRKTLPLSPLTLVLQDSLKDFWWNFFRRARLV